MHFYLLERNFYCDKISFYIFTCQQATMKINQYTVSPTNTKPIVLQSPSTEHPE